MQTTEYFELNIVEGSDLVNPLTQQNPNFEKIDEQMFKNQNNGVCLATELKTASVHAINRTVPDCAMFRFTATSDFVSGDTFTVDGVQVTAKLTNGQPLGTGAFVINSEVIGVLVGTLVTFYVESGVVPTASDSERLGGELPNYYATKAEVDQAQQLAEATSVIAQNNQNSISELNNRFEWKFHNRATGASAIALPTTFNELHIINYVTVAGRVPRYISSLKFIKEELRADGDYYYFSGGKGPSNSRMAMAFITNTTYTLAYSSLDENVHTSDSVTEIYYR